MDGGVLDLVSASSSRPHEVPGFGQLHARALSALGLISGRWVTVLLNPLDEHFPLILVLKEPLAYNFTLPSDFENPL